MVTTRVQATVVGLAMTVAASSFAADVKLPKNISWTAYGTTSSGYAQSVGIGQMLTKNYGSSLRIIPGKNDVSRMVPLREGKSDICACGAAALFAQEGSLMFGSKRWGPMRIHNLFNNLGANGQSLMTTMDSGIKTAKDLKGKRLTWVKGGPALNANSAAFLAFAGLTWDDVTKVVVPGWKQSADAVLNGQADATWGSTASSAYNKQAAAPGGIYWMALPHSDTEGWARAQAVNPLWVKSTISVGVKIAQNEQGTAEYEGNNYPYPMFVANSTMSDELAYSLTKATLDNYEQIKDSGPSMLGYQVSRQPLTFVYPYHAGSVTYFKEKGVWTAEHEAHNAKLLKRQDVLAAAWATMDKNMEDDAFVAAWQTTRVSALETAGLAVTYRSW
jgi:TRAP transporter TAXI family solute receptor